MINRQLYQAINQLERLQRQRKGEKCAAATKLAGLARRPDDLG
jgi:hypothetical protein